MRMWCNGSTSDFQSDGLGPTPSIRTYKQGTEMEIVFDDGGPVAKLPILFT